MRKQLILYLLVIINATNVQSTTVVAGQLSEGEARASLTALTRVNQALPVIFFAIPGNENLQPVIALSQAEINRKKIVSGTKFYSTTSRNQMYFCPDSYSDQTCLIPQNFLTSQILECASEPKPVLQPFPGEYHCGANNTGILLSFNYDMCPPAAPYNYTSQSTSIYMICYDGSRSKNLYVSYTMYGASMLTENLLIREREVNIPMNNQHFGYIDPHYYYNLQIEANNSGNYGLQTLVPPEDMPLATLRKATHYYANYELQHIEFMWLWNAIRGYIRHYASMMTNQILTIMTGVFDIPLNQFPTPTVGNEMTTIWVTQIMAMTGNGQAGLAILMNNFTTPGQRRYYIDHLCDNKNSCVSNLQRQFAGKRGVVRCCSVTKKIMNLFYFNHPGPRSLQPLLINGINI